MDALLDNIFWASLTGEHAALSAGDGRARRYARGFPALAGSPDPARPDLAAFEPLFEPGEPFYICGWKEAAPSGWRIDFDGSVLLMVRDEVAPVPDPAPEATRLGLAHVERMVALATATRPGPFGPRNLEMGEYYGFLEGDRLIAMAGERMHAGRYREVSAVCTDPAYQGRGLARRLTEKVAGIQAARGEVPFLHVMAHNARARQMYERMGFRTAREYPVRVVART